jgi:hypothetical protein
MSEDPDYLTYFRQVGKEQAQEAADMLRQAERLLQSAMANLVVSQQEGEYPAEVVNPEQVKAEEARELAARAWVIASGVAHF